MTRIPSRGVNTAYRASNDKAGGGWQIHAGQWRMATHRSVVGNIRETRALSDVSGSETLPGLLTERGVVDIFGGGAQKLHAAAHDAGHHRRLRPIAPGAGEARQRRGTAIPLDKVRLRPPLPRPGKILACIANYWEHAQREARPLNMFMKNPDAVIGPGDTIVLPEFTVPWIFMHEAELALVIKGPAKMVKAEGLEERRVRLHLDDRRLGARAGPPHLAGDAAHQLARQILRHLCADRSLHRHRRRDRRIRTI